MIAAVHRNPNSDQIAEESEISCPLQIVSREVNSGNFGQVRPESSATLSESPFRDL